MPHIIRLRGPWEYEVLNGTAGQPGRPPNRSSGRVQMPCDWTESIGSGFTGRVRYRRFFNWTAPLTNGQTVTLAFDGVRQSATVTLNDEPLGAFGPGPTWFSIGPLLKASNELVVDVECGDATSPGGLTGEVRLEIE